MKKQFLFFSLREIITLNLTASPIPQGERFYGRIWYPFNSLFLYGVSPKFVFYKIEYTLSFLNFFLKFLEVISYNYGNFFLFSNLKQISFFIKNIFNNIQTNFVFARFKWVSGLFTNLPVFVSLIARLKSFFSLTKNKTEFKLFFIRYLIKFSDLHNLTTVPDLAFCTDASNSINFLNECRNLWIPTSGLLTINFSKSHWLTYPIPFNIASKDGLLYLLYVIRRAFVKGILRTKKRFLFQIFSALKFQKTKFSFYFSERLDVFLEYMRYLYLSIFYTNFFFRSLYFFNRNLKFRSKRFFKFYQVKFSYFVERSKKYIRSQAFRFRRGKRYKWFRIYKRRRGVFEIFGRFRTSKYIKGFLFGEEARLVRLFFKNKRKNLLLAKGFIKKKFYPFAHLCSIKKRKNLFNRKSFFSINKRKRNLIFRNVLKFFSINLVSTSFLLLKSITFLNKFLVKKRLLKLKKSIKRKKKFIKKKIISFKKPFFKFRKKSKFGFKKNLKFKPKKIYFDSKKKTNGGFKKSFVNYNYKKNIKFSYKPS